MIVCADGSGSGLQSALGFRDRQIVDARLTPLHQA